MKEYHKIQTVFLRNPETNYQTLLEGTWSKPEFELLKDVDWVCTEKIDGTNIRIMWDGESVSFGGKTDKAETPKHLLSKLHELFPNEKLYNKFGSQGDVCLYGEGYGTKIQKGGNYIPDDTNFILFDIKVGSWWLERPSIEEIAKEMNIDVTPVISVCKLSEAIEYVKCGFKSTIAHNKDYLAEGLIAKPRFELFSRSGERIVTKIKHRDFL